MFDRHAVIVTAAGSSTRFNNSLEDSVTSGVKKEFLKLEGHTILYRACEHFLETENLVAVFVTYREGTKALTEGALEDLTTRGIPFYLVQGGNTRQQSVFNALKEIYRLNGELKVKYVSIHDGARPFVSKDTIMDTLAYAKLFGAAVPGLSVRDTLVRVDEEGFIEAPMDRTGAYTVQTPQVFRFPDIFDAHVNAIKEGKDYTDDTQVYSAFGRKVAVVSGSPENIKITYGKDIK